MADYNYMTDKGKAMSTAGYWDHSGYGGGDYSLVPQAMSNNLPYQAGTLVDAPLSAGMIPPWVLAAGSIGYLGGKYDVFGKAKDAVGSGVDYLRN